MLRRVCSKNAQAKRSLNMTRVLVLQSGRNHFFIPLWHDSLSSNAPGPLHSTGTGCSLHHLCHPVPVHELTLVSNAIGMAYKRGPATIRCVPNCTAPASMNESIRALSVRVFLNLFEKVTGGHCRISPINATFAPERVTVNAGPIADIVSASASCLASTASKNHSFIATSLQGLYSEQKVRILCSHRTLR